MRERLTADGWDIVWDQEFEASEESPPGYTIRGEREDGLAIEFQVSDHTTALWRKSGCVRDTDWTAIQKAIGPEFGANAKAPTESVGASCWWSILGSNQ